ncbi:hemagglutinin repeat-containing protein [Fusobacterium sp. PH5-44]|uniref:hemagglutinin repeat-containing protein n=1 Tax=unclassified Fusobacterium TaxID=2648384 RepID=UPI003D236F65
MGLVGGNVVLNGDNLHVRGSNLAVEGNLEYNIKKNILIEAGKNTFEENGKSSGYSVGFSTSTLDSKGMVNPFANPNGSMDIGYNQSKNWGEGVNYTNSSISVGGNTHYDVGGDLTIKGADISTGSISGQVAGSTWIESLQDEYKGGSSGFGFNVSLGLSSQSKPQVNSVSGNYSQTKIESKVTTSPTIFKADGGQFDAGQKLVQIGSIVDGTFALNAKDYEFTDLKDIRKETSIGFNVTIYPNTVYNARDGKGDVIFNGGQRIKQEGVTISSGLQFGYVNENRDIKATIGNGVITNFDTQGVNRDIEKAVSDWQGTNIETFSVNLLTEYWLTQAGRGAFRDQVDDAKRGVKGLKDILTSKGKFSDLVKGEKFVRRLEELGIFDIKGKTEDQIAAEIRARASHLLDSDLEVEVKFYKGDDLSGAILDEVTINKLFAKGFAVASDGSIWINTSVLANNTLDFNKTFAHEIGHLMGGNETVANYMSKSYGEFVGGIASSGYVDIGGSIRDWGKKPLNGEDANRLLKYKEDEIQLELFTAKNGELSPLQIEMLKQLGQHDRSGSLKNEYHGIVLPNGKHVYISLKDFKMDKEGNVSGDIYGIGFEFFKSLTNEQLVGMSYFHFRNGMMVTDPMYEDGSQAFKGPTDFIYASSLDDIYKGRLQLDSRENTKLLLTSGAVLVGWSVAGAGGLGNLLLDVGAMSPALGKLILNMDKVAVGGMSGLGAASTISHYKDGNYGDAAVSAYFTLYGISYFMPSSNKMTPNAATIDNSKPNSYIDLDSGAIVENGKLTGYLNGYEAPKALGTSIGSSTSVPAINSNQISSNWSGLNLPAENLTFSIPGITENIHFPIEWNKNRTDTVSSDEQFLIGYGNSYFGDQMSKADSARYSEFWRSNGIGSDETWKPFKEANPTQTIDDYFELLNGQSPWPKGYTPVQINLQGGFKFEMAMGKNQENPGGFATDINTINSVDYTRNNLAIKLGWKGEIGKVGEFQVNDGKILPVNIGPVGPQIDLDLNKYLPGGANQYEMKIDMNKWGNFIELINTRKIK